VWNSQVYFLLQYKLAVNVGATAILGSMGLPLTAILTIIWATGVCVLKALPTMSIIPLATSAPPIIWDARKGM
jgi:hypothetical protein